MTNEELHKKLEAIKISLDKAHKEGNTDKINYYLKGLNKLWEKNSEEMKKNAKKDGYHPPSYL